MLYSTRKKSIFSFLEGVELLSENNFFLADATVLPRRKKYNFYDAIVYFWLTCNTPAEQVSFYYISLYVPFSKLLQILLVSGECCFLCD